MLDTGRLPPFFASPYSRSRLTNASANGVSRGFLGEGGVNGSSDSDDLSSPPATSLTGAAGTSAGRATGSKRSQRKSRGPGAHVPPPGATIAATAVSPDLGSAASAVEALLSLNNSRESLLARLSRENDMFPDSASLQLLALGCQQQQTGAGADNQVTGAAATASLSPRPQTALDLAALSLLSAGYPLKEGQQQQQDATKAPAVLLLQQLANLDSSAALLKLLGDATFTANAGPQHPGIAALCTQQPAKQQPQQQWEREAVDSQLLSMPLKPLLSREVQEITQGGSPVTLLHGVSNDTTSPLCSLDCASMELNGFGTEQTGPADGRRLRDAGDNFAVRDVGKESAAQSLAKERDLLLEFLATADQAYQQHQQQHQRQPQEDMLSALSSLVSLLGSMRRQDAAEQPLARAVEALSSLVKPQTPADQQQQEPAATIERDSAALHQHQAAWLHRPVAEEQWNTSCDSAAASNPELLEKDRAFSASLLRFLQGQQGRDPAVERAAAADALAATRTPEAIQEPRTSSEEQADAPPREGAKQGTATSRSTSTSSCASSSNNTAVDVSVNAATAAKASRRSSDASSSSEAIAVSPPADSASASELRSKERNGESVSDQEPQQRGKAPDLSVSAAEAPMLLTPAVTATPAGWTGGNRHPVAIDTRLVDCGSW